MRNDRQRRRNHAQAKTSAEAFVQFLDLAAQIFGLGENAMRVIQSEPALWRQADKTMAALDDRRAEVLLELPDRRRKRRLRDVTGFRRPAEMLFSSPRDEIFELPQKHAVC